MCLVQRTVSGVGSVEWIQAVRFVSKGLYHWAISRGSLMFLREKMEFSFPLSGFLWSAGAGATLWWDGKKEDAACSVWEPESEKECRENWDDF